MRLRASEAPNLKAALKKIIRDATTVRGGDGDDAGEGEEVLDVRGRKYLDYDLEALHVFLKQGQQQQQRGRRVVVAFQDSEAFDSALLTELVTLFQ